MPAYSVRILSLALAVVAAGILVPPSARAQEETPRAYTIRGTVLGAASGQPLADVQVALVGTPHGTISGPDGNFAVEASVPPGTYTVRFTLIGRRPVERQVELAAAGPVSMGEVGMEVTAVQLEDIVVTGVGVTAERKALGNTVESISGERVNESPGTSSLDVALQGKITGAVISEYSGQPGGGATVRLRGTSSILGSAEPLYVIDGVIVDNSAEALVSVGANATYSGAGVTNRIADLVPGQIERIEVLKGAAAAGLYGSRANSGVIQIFTKQGADGATRVTYRSDFSVNETPGRYDLVDIGTAGVGDATFGGVPGLEAGDPVQRHDLQDELWRTGLGTDQQLSISGGGGGTNFYISGNYVNEQGIVRSTEYEKWSVRANLSQRVSDRITVDVTGNYVDSHSSFVPEGEQTQGLLTAAIFTPTVWDFRFDEELGRYPYNPVLGANPLDVIANWRLPEDVTRLLGGVQGTWDAADRLTVRAQVGIDDYRQENQYLQPPQSTSASFTGSVQSPVKLSTQINANLTGEYDVDLSESLVATTTAGLTYTDDREEVIRAGASDLPPGQQLVGGATQFASQGVTEIRTAGGFLQERLGLDDRLFLTGGLNVEASSAFGVDERWQLFPRASASWLVHEEDFWEGGLAGTISTLRLRGAYGQTGGQPPGAYSRFDNYVNVSYAGRAGLVGSQLVGNPDLKPERQWEAEGGLELGLWADRALLDLTYYHQVTDDLVLSVPLAPSSGAQSQFQNVGELQNRGIEASVTAIPVQSPALTWTSRLQVAHNASEVTQLVTDADTVVTGYLNAVAVGEPVGVFYGGFYARDAQGNIQYDDAGLPLRARDEAGVFARRIIGDPNPDLTTSLQNTVQLGGNLQLDLLFEGRFGNDVANFTRRITEFFGVDEAVEREITGDTVPGTYTLNPNGRINIYEEYVEDGSFVKLRELSLSYTFDDLTGFLGARTLSVRVAGRNLLTVTDYTGLDPEVNLFAANSVARGVDFATTPVPRSLHVGFTLTM